MTYKRQITVVYDFMKKDKHDFINNALLAQLNDVAYRAIRKTGLQKRLDERALKNETMNKTLQLQLDEAHKNIDFGKIEVDRKEFIEKIGTCPIS